MIFLSFKFLIREITFVYRTHSILELHNFQ